MLIQLQIENVAVIEKANIDFSVGFNVLTGETGAGKSIIIDSINAVTGEKTSKDIIRTGASKAKISAVFGDFENDAINALTELGCDISEDGMLLLSRELSSEGRSVFRLNGALVPMAVVKQIAPILINIHGQHDSQQLFSPSKHVGFIDGYASLTDKVSEYRAVYKEMCEVKDMLLSLETDDELKERKIELLSFQIDEISAAELQNGEEDELLSRRDMIKNSGNLAESVSSAHSILNGDDRREGALSLVRDAAYAISQISEFDSEFSALSERANNVVYELEDIFSEIRAADGRFDFDENELDALEERLDLIFRLKQKYGGSVEDILLKLEALQTELDGITFGEQRKEELENKYKLLKERATAIAEEISKKRADAAAKLCEQIMSELNFLDMPNVKFAVEQNRVELKSDGCDQIEFLISANSGEELKPISKIASGGELSRIMLAIKTVLTDGDLTGTLIFDEIDTGVSGKTARKIGEKIRLVSKNKQVLCVTHLAQIASLADSHLYIEKKQTDDKTYTSVRVLDENERVYEVARIMGGEIITDATLEAARELILI
ncbi:MAG: DNA repair protein RecN [Oscillospiraceae bacterium]|nr:DNA repair protein RecN [Oscillospiraceae bacterium]